MADQVLRIVETTIVRVLLGYAWRDGAIFPHSTPEKKQTDA